MELPSSHPHFTPLARANEDYARLRSAAAAEALRRDEHDSSLVIAALEEVESQRADVEVLMEAGVLGNCLSG
jgi:hypothetical protein